MDPKEEIRRRVDVAELISEYLTLKPAGGGSFKSVCPFHQDKDPSFHVSKEKQIWHCFGCDMGGDIFAFVMEIESVEFPEALRILGKKAGVEITRYTSSDSNEKQRMIALHDLVTKFYQKILIDSTQAADARAYLENRGIDKGLIEKFQLGFSPEGWDTLVQFLSKRGYNATEVERSGLAQRKKSGVGSIDKFRNRVMIPLSDHHNNVVGFTARIMKQTDDFQGPKYMNSPETLIYKKSELLYGLNLAKSAIKMAGAVIVVEGNLDVIASHKAGVENVVASSGTALTEQQIQLLKRFTDNIIFSFDQDAAGFAAAQRGIRLAQSLDMKVKVVILPPEAGKDPDDAVQKDPKLWIKAVDNPIPIMEYYFEQSSRNKDLSDVEHKREVGKFLIPEIASISDQIEQEHWLQKLSGMINIDIEILRGMVRKIKGEVYIKVVKKPEAKITKRSRTDQAVIMVLGLFLQYPEFQDKVMEKLDIEQIDSTELQDLYKILTNEYNKNNPSTKQKSFFAELREKISQNEESGGIVNLLDEIALKGEEISVENTQDNVLAQLNDFIHVINQAGIDQEKKQLEQQIRQAEEQGDSKVVQKLLEKFNSLN
jgi:DNA primase